MTTRCNVRIDDGLASVYLYRHHDGYPAETGADLLRIVETVTAGTFMTDGDIVPLVNAILLTGAHVHTDHTGAPEMRLRYEYTDGPHDDIEHFYVIDIAEDAVRFGHASQPWQPYGGELLEARVKRYTPAEFRALVAAATSCAAD